MDALKRFQALNSMAGFARYLDLGDGGYQATWYSEMLCYHLDLIMRTVRGLPGGLDALAIFMPPRHGKTFHASEMLPAYCYALDPAAEIIALTYSMERAKDATKAVGRIMDSPAYRALTEARIGRLELQEVDDLGRLVTRRESGTANANRMDVLYPGQAKPGGYLSTSLGGPCTGLGANLMIFDDLIKNAEEAESTAKRIRNETELELTAFTRLYKRSAQVLISTRWHPLDPCEFLLRRWHEQGLNYRVLTFRAEREEEELGFNDPRSPGEFLDPERIGVRRYAQMRSGASWAALYQQRPESRTGKLFPSHVWQRFNPEILSDPDLSVFDGVALSLDANHVEGASSYAQIDVWALVTLPGATPHDRSHREAWKVGERRGKWGYSELKDNFAAEWIKWGSACKWQIIESKVNGLPIIDEIEKRRLLPEEHQDLYARAQLVKFDPKKYGGSKENRASRASDIILKGLCALPAKKVGKIEVDWIEEHEAEWERFPKEPNDRVDAGVQFLLWAQDEQGLVPPG